MARIPLCLLQILNELPPEALRVKVDAEPDQPGKARNKGDLNRQAEKQNEPEKSVFRLSQIATLAPVGKAPSRSSKQMKQTLVPSTFSPWS